MDRIDRCRSCGAEQLVDVVDFGDTPAADALIDPAGPASEPSYPLVLAFCFECRLVQLRHTVAPHVLFGDDYPYYSSFSTDLSEHSRENARRLVASRRLDSTHTVVEVASNDGYLLRHFRDLGVGVLGIDPARGPSAAARAAGIPTIGSFFGVHLARELRRSGVRADVVVANNVLAHVADLNGFVQGLATLVAPDGVISIEVPSVQRLVEQGAFDTIYHEHLCYFSVSSLVPLFRRHGLRLVAVDDLWIHGGSFRLTVAPASRPGVADDEPGPVRARLADEEAAGVTKYGYYVAFEQVVRRRTRALRAALLRLRLDGIRIAAYGAAAKGACLLNVARLDERTIDFVVDRNVHKHGRLMPGSRIPIRAPEALLSEAPDVCVLLAWNFQREILEQQREYVRGGGRFLIPVPRPHFAAA